MVFRLLRRHHNSGKRENDYRTGLTSAKLDNSDKIPHFYDAINRKEDAISLEDWNAKSVYGALNELVESNNYYADTNYLMTLYDYLFDTLKNIWNKEDEIEEFTFEQITAKLKSMSIPMENELFDMKVKLYRGEKRYFSQYMKLRRSDSDIKELRSKVKNQKNLINKQEKELSSTEQSLKKSEQKVKELQDRLDRIDNMLIVRAYKKNKRIINRVKRVFKLSYKQMKNE